MDLTLKDLGSVRKETFEARSKWYDVGLELGVPVDELDCIQCDHGGEAKDCHLEMLKCWLKAADSTTWAALVEALGSDVVGENALARRLEEKINPLLKKPLKKPEDGGLAGTILPNAGSA